MPVIDLTMLDSESDKGSQNSAPGPNVSLGNDEGPMSEDCSVLGQDAITGESEGLPHFTVLNWPLKPLSCFLSALMETSQTVCKG